LTSQGGGPLRRLVEGRAPGRTGGGGKELAGAEEKGGELETLCNGERLSAANGLGKRKVFLTKEMKGLSGLPGLRVNKKYKAGIRRFFWGVHRAIFVKCDAMNRNGLTRERDVKRPLTAKESQLKGSGQEDEPETEWGVNSAKGPGGEVEENVAGKEALYPLLKTQEGSLWKRNK